MHEITHVTHDWGGTNTCLNYKQPQYSSLKLQFIILCATNVPKTFAYNKSLPDIAPHLFTMCKTKRHNNRLPVTGENKLVFSLCNEWAVLQYLNLNRIVILKRSALRQHREDLLQAAIVSAIVLPGDLN